MPRRDPPHPDATAPRPEGADTGPGALLDGREATRPGFSRTRGIVPPRSTPGRSTRPPSRRSRGWRIPSRLLPLVPVALLACAPPVARPVDAHALLDAVRKAHTGGRRVEQLTFHTLDELRPSVGEFFYPELMPDWRAFNVVRYRVPFMSQVAVVGGDRITWTLEGTLLATLRNGRPYTPTLGIPRVQHLRVNRWLFMPSEAFVDADMELALLPDARDGMLRLGLQERGPPGEHITLEVDPRTFLCTAVEYTARAIHLPGVLRAELLDTRDVGGARVAHRIHETVPTGGAGLPFHDVTLWDVQVQFAAP